MNSMRRLALTISRRDASMVSRSVVVPRMAAAPNAISRSTSTDVLLTGLTIPRVGFDGNDEGRTVAGVGVGEDAAYTAIHAMKYAERAVGCLPSGSPATAWLRQPGPHLGSWPRRALSRHHRGVGDAESRSGFLRTL